MGALNLGSNSEEASTKKRLTWRSPKVIIGVALLVAVPAIGSTLAANITINSNANVEFGQGVTLAAACDDNITLTPYSTFSNEVTGGHFQLWKITLSGLAQACDAARITLTAWSNSAQVGQWIIPAGGLSTPQGGGTNNTFASHTQNTWTAAAWGGSGDARTFILDFSPSALNGGDGSNFDITSNSNSINKFTIETTS